jgi:DNA-binding transcriptional regulator YiaG
MPVAIALLPGDVIPAILFEATDAALVQRLRGLVGAPALDSADAAKVWLGGMPEPSGWYADVAAARQRLAQMTRPEDMTGAEVEKARAALGLSRDGLAQALGMKGNSNTNHKYLWEVEKGGKKLGPAACRRLRALLAESGLPSDH